MKRFLFSLVTLNLSLLTGMAQTGYPITPVPFTSVKVTPGTFWGQRLEASRNTTIPLAFSKCESEGRYKNFENAAAHLKDPSKMFKVNGVGYSFDDTDPYKTIEGASYIRTRNWRLTATPLSISLRQPRSPMVTCTLPVRRTLPTRTIGPVIVVGSRRRISLTSSITWDI